MEAGGSSTGGSNAGRWRRRSSPGGAGAGGDIRLLGADILHIVFAFLDHFDLVRCSAVCKSWHSIIYASTLMRDLYYKRGSNIGLISDMSVPSKAAVKIYLEELAMEEHKLAMLYGSAEVHQWKGHSVGVSQCRMKMGLILSGVGDKTLRLWSAESYRHLGEYSISGMSPLVDFDFDESKIVGLVGNRICIWRRNGKRSVFQSREGSFTRSLCMRYIDPEAVVGCEDGRTRIFDMYSGSCSRIIRMHPGPVTSLALTDDQLILAGSSFGSITVADLSSGERVAFLKSSISPIGIRSLQFNMHSHLVFAGSTAGYLHCWDLRTLRPLWESRISSNVIHSIHHLSRDTSILAAGGIDGVLRILNQNTGDVLSSYVVDRGNASTLSSENEIVERYRARALLEDARIDSIPRHVRPSITCLAVGMKKIVTVHNEKYVRMWKFKGV